MFRVWRFAIVAVCMLFAAQSTVCGQTLEIGKVSIDNIGLGQRMIRLDDNGGIFLDDAGMCLEVTVGIEAKGLAGKRVFAMVFPLDPDENSMADQNGDAMSVGAVNIPGATYSGKIVVPMPYQWIITEENKKRQAVKMGVALSLFDEEYTVSKVVDLQESDINIDRNKVGSKLMGDMFGGSEGLMGSVLDGLFSTSDAEATMTCPACDGTGLCGKCDGMGFFDPTSCRKCSRNPGICTRCKGEGAITVEVDFY